MRTAVAATVAIALLAGCVPHKVTPGTTQTVVTTRTRVLAPSSSPDTYVAPPARSVAPLPPGVAPAKGEVERACPYVASTPDAGPNSVANIIGSHVLRTTVITTTHPVGCQFYFYAPPYEAIADIVAHRFGSAAAAYQAMIATARAGTSASGHKDLIPGVDAVLFRTKFFGPDGARDWSCAFAAGTALVVVHTQRDDTSFSALRLATVIAPKFV